MWRRCRFSLRAGDMGGRWTLFEIRHLASANGFVGSAPKGARCRHYDKDKMQAIKEDKYSAAKEQRKKEWVDRDRGAEVGVRLKSSGAKIRSREPWMSRARDLLTPHLNPVGRYYYYSYVTPFTRIWTNGPAGR